MRTMIRKALVVAVTASVLAVADGARADDAGADRAPVVIKQDEPEYPFSLRLTGKRGEVLVDFIVDPQGNVVKAGVTRSSHPDFEAPAVESVLKWKFKPGIKNGHPVYTHMAVPIYFQLKLANGGNGIDPWTIPSRAPKGTPAEFLYDEAPRPLLTSAPVYPYELLVSKVKGSASVAFSIDPTGRTHVVKLLSASLPEFGAATTAMIEAWRFEPAKKDGKPCWAVLRKDQEFVRNGDEFPMNESAERLLKVLKKDPNPIITDFRQLDTPLKGRFTPSPVLPDAVHSANVAAEAVVEFIVDHAGHAQLPRVVSATDPAFGWASATAVARWQYSAPTKDGRPVDVRVRVPLTFSPPNPAPKGA